MSKLRDPYTPSFYKSIIDSARSSAHVVVPLLIEHIGATSVLDVGCGPGTWLSVFAEADLEDLHGIDQDQVPVDALQVPEAWVERANLGSGRFDLGRKFELAVCLEVAEHLPFEASDALVASLCRHTDAIVFSAAIPGQGGYGHINEQWQSWWAGRFHEHGFAAYDLLRPVIWGDGNVAWWYRQNVVVYANNEASLDAARRVEKLESLDLVHPELWKRDEKYLGMRRIFKNVPDPIRGPLSRSVRSASEWLR